LARMKRGTQSVCRPFFDVSKSAATHAIVIECVIGGAVQIGGPVHANGSSYEL
jgi:hypothetical protein